ncbi:MAG: polysaccharide biosynthesis C-terminal domain-containing protein, partial [Ignavibacteria bacterium]|nr:polysaccharide biosynthesis C-terminal domain-containing protein [Ignavibacteria bacterium]
RDVFSVPFISVTGSSLLFSAAIWFSSDAIAVATGAGAAHGSLVRYSALILFLDAISHVPFAVLRMDRKAKQFAFIRVAGIVVNVLCVVWFLVVLEMEMDGIFLAGAIASSFVVLLLLPTVLINFAPSWSGPLFRALISYGLPTLPAGLAAIALQVIDRPILEALTDAATVGIYQANYRLGIFMMLIVSMFEFAWRPFFFSAGNEASSKEMFARVLTYLLLAMTGLFLFLTFFLEGLIKTPFLFGYSVLPDSYWGGYGVVPLVLIGYMFLGISTVFSAGLYLEKKTALLPVVTIGGAAVNIASNFFLIPAFGMNGAGIATLLSYAVMAILMFAFSQRVSPVRYEWGRISLIVLVGSVTYVAGLFVSPPIPPAIWHTGLLFMALVLLRLLRFFDPSELKAMRSIFNRQPKQEPPDLPISEG